MFIEFPKVEKHKVTYATFAKMMIWLFLKELKFPFSYNQYLANKYDFNHTLSEEEYNIISNIYFNKCCLYCLFTDLYFVVSNEKMTFKDYEIFFFEHIKNAMIDYGNFDIKYAEKKTEEYIKDIKRLKINESIDCEEKIPTKFRKIFYTEIACGDIDKMDDIDRYIDIIRDYCLRLLCMYSKKTTFLDK